MIETEIHYYPRPLPGSDEWWLEVLWDRASQGDRRAARQFLKLKNKPRHRA